MNIVLLEMGNPEIGLGASVALVVIGCVITYVAVRGAMSQELDALRAQIAELNASIAQSTEKPAEPVKAMAAAAGAGFVSAAKPPVPVVPIKTPPLAQEIPDEILVVITAAVAAFLGKKARLRHTRLVVPSGTNAWAQQGRVFVQASHNLGVSHHG